MQKQEKCLKIIGPPGQDSVLQESWTLQVHLEVSLFIWVSVQTADGDFGYFCATPSEVWQKVKHANVKDLSGRLKSRHLVGVWCGSEVGALISGLLLVCRGVG